MKQNYLIKVKPLERDGIVINAKMLGLVVQIPNFKGVRRNPITINYSIFLIPCYIGALLFLAIFAAGLKTKK